MAQVDAVSVLWWIAAVVSVASAITVVASKSPVYSVLFLVLNFFATSLVFLLLGAEFLAITQILVYAGAILVLFLFVVMLLNLRRTEGLRTGPMAVFSYLLAAGTGLLFVWKLASTIPSFEPTQKDAPVGSIQVIGQLLYTRYLFVFEATSVLLFVAVIGAVVLAKQAKAARATVVPSGAEVVTRASASVGGGVAVRTEGDA